MKLKAIYLGGTCCAGGRCPTVYETDNGTYVIQGYQIDTNLISDLPQGETVIELPKEFLEGFVKNFTKNNI